MDGNREHSADALCWLLNEVDERLQRCKDIRYDNVDETKTERVCIQRVNDWKVMRELVSLAITRSIKERQNRITDGLDPATIQTHKSTDSRDSLGASVCSNIADELEEAIRLAIENCETFDVEVLTLIQRSSEAVATLRMYGDLNIKSIIYDMSRLAAGAGWTPDDFDEKANL